MQGKQQDFRTEKYIRYGIRKYSFGAASVAIAAGLMFLGNGVVSATEVQSAETAITTSSSSQGDKETEKAEPKAETVETVKPETVKPETVKPETVKPETEKAAEVKPEVKVEDTKKVNKAILEASIATLESKLSTAKYADATVVSSAKEVLAAAKATLAKADAGQADLDAQAETVSALSTVVTESNTAGFDKKQATEKEAAKAEADKKATPAEKALSVATTTLIQVSSEAEVTNKLAETELSKADVKEENRAAVTEAVAKNKVVLTETKALLADKSVTKEQVDAQLERLNESILAVYNELKNAGIGRDGKFAVNLSEAQTTALKDASTETGKKWLEDHGYSSLSDIKVKTKEENLKEIKDLNDQIQWLDFGDKDAWTNLTASNQLQIGSTYKKELIPGYIVTMTVKELKPFESTEIFKNRVAGTDLESSYQPDKENKFNPDNGATGLGANPQNRYTHVANAGLTTGGAKTTIAGTNPAGRPQNGQAAGVKFDVTATYNGKPVKPGIVMTSGEDIGPLESEIYTTDGTPWDLAAIVGYGSNKNAYVPLDKFKDMNGGKTAILKWQDEKFYNALSGGKFATPDTATAGLGSQVFGGYRNNSGAGTPVLSTANVTEVGFYIMSSGQQSSMIGIKFSDFGDLPESYGMAEHYLRTQSIDYDTKAIKQIQQPYLGKVKADIDSAPGTRVRGIGSDDATETGDEGVDQLIAPDNVHINKDTGRPEVQLVKGPDNTYKVKVLASANGNDKYTDTVAPAYVRGFIDFNNNGKFDEGEQSDIVQVNGNGQEVELTFTNTQVIDTTKDVVNFRVRIAKDASQVERPNGIAYSGEVEDNQIQVIHPPRGDKEETTGKQGETQSVGIEFRTRALGDDASDLGSNNGKTTFNSYGKISYTEQSNVISAETTKKVQTEGVMIVDPSGNLVKSYTKAGQGTYTVTDDKVTFTPEANFVGKADGIVLRAVDSNGQSTGWTALTAQNGLENINDGTHTTATKTMDAVYIPTVTPKEITADPETSTDVQGKEQKKTPKFKTEGDSATPETPNEQYPAKLVDPKTGAKVDSVTVDGEGTYTINPTTGEVTFQPLPTFKGTASGVDVTLTAPVGQDKDGQPVTATATTKYTPTVTAVEPTAKPADSAGVQGETQKGTPTFTAGNAEVPIKENSHKLLDKEGNEVPAGQTTPAYAEDGVTPVGTYSIDPTTGEVTFTPTDKSYTGKVTPAKVQAEDKNGTKVNTTYTPHIVGVTPTAEPAETTDVQGVEQSKEVTFKPGKATIDGVEKEVPIDTTSYKLLDENGQPAESVPAKNPAGDVIGTYTLKVVDGKATAVFTPTDKTYAGEVEPVTIQAKDTNGTPVTTTYTPNITPVEPKGKPTSTEGAQGQPQEGTPTFTPGNDKVPMKIDAEQPAKLIDPATGQPTDETTIPAKDANGKEVGTYTIDPTTGKVTFTPNKDFVGTPVPATVQAKDANGTPTTATYTPTVYGVKGNDDTTKDVQGAVQTSKPGSERFSKLNTPENTPDGTNVDLTTAKYSLEGADNEGKVVVPNEGTYTIDPTTGVVTFTPLPTFTGTAQGVDVKVTANATDKEGAIVEVTATGKYTPVVEPVKPTAEAATSTDVQGATQEQPVTFNDSKTTIDGVEKKVPIDPTTYTLLDENGQPASEVPAKDASGKVVGTYTVKNVDGKAVAVFTPTDKTYVGKVEPVTVQAKDKNGTPVTTTYTPNITPVKPTGTPATSEGIQGSPQEGTPTFTQGHPVAPIKIDATQPAKLVDPTTGKPTDEPTIPAKDATGKQVGTYTIDPTSGKVTFTPNKDFVGTPVPATVEVKDANGTPATATYTPTVKPVTPIGKVAFTEDIQGATQSGKPAFEGGKTTVNGKEETVPMDDTVPATFEDGNTTKTIPGEGTYTVAPDGTVTFVPEKTFTGKGTTLTVIRKDKNGTPARGEYTAVVHPVTPTGWDVISADIQGQEQNGKPKFKGGTVEIGGEEKKVDIDENVAPVLLDPATKQPVAVGTPITVKGEGVYTLQPDGTVNFVPEKTFVGEAKGVIVQRVDKLGQPAIGKYRPIVIGAKPKAQPATSQDVQGQVQKQPVTFIDSVVDKTTVPDIDIPDVKVAVQKTVPIDPATYTLLDENGQPATKVPAKDPEGNVIGEYTLEVVDGKAIGVLTPNATYYGAVQPVRVQAADKNGITVETTYTPYITPVTPTATPATSEGIQGKTQEGTPTFTEGDKKVPINLDKAPKLVDPTTGKPTEEKSVKVPNEGTYEIDENGKVTFTPEPNFTGQAKGIEVQREDKNGTPVNGKYTPFVKPVTPKGDEKETQDIQGAPQKSTPTFTGGKTTVNGKEETVEINYEKPAKLVDPTTGKPTDETTVKVPNEGTYTIDPKTGEVTFTPEPNFTGRGTGVSIQRVDKNGTPAESTYTPTVVGVTPTGKEAKSKDLQGETQTGKPTFTGGKTTVNGKEETVEIDNDKPATFEDGSTTKVVPNEGTYTVAPDGTVTFVPEPQFTGVATGVTVKRVDKNGTPVTATYTPTVIPVSPSGEDVTSVGPKNTPQEGTPIFKGGSETLDGKKKTVEIDKDVPATFEDGKTTKVVPGEGTYTVDKDGKVIFTPERDFVGVTKGVTVKRVDKNGTPVTATYTPTVLGATSTKDVVSEGPKGKPQSNTPVFEGDVDKDVPPTFEDGKTTKVVPGEGTYTIDPNGKVTFTPEPDFVGTTNGVTVVRKDKNGKAISATYTPTVRPETIFRDKEGKEIPNYPSEDGTTPKKDIPGYRFVETNTLPNGDTEHVYEKVKTSFKDKEGKEIPNYPTEDGEQPKKDIPGYRFVETKTLPNGDTEHVYEKVKTSFKDKEGNEIPGYPTEDGEQPKKDIPGYRFVETKTLSNGDIEHVYEKVSTPAPTPSPVPQPTPGKQNTTTWTDENGNPLKPTEPGSKEPGTVSGYEYVKTVTDPNGNIKHIFKKVEMPTSRPVEPSQPATPKYVEGQKELPNTGTEDNNSLAALGLLGVLSGFGLVARKKKED